MVRLLTVPILFLVSLSVVPIFADTGSLTVISGNSYTITYDANNVKIVDVQPNTSLGELLISIQVSSQTASLSITMPRALIDSKDNSGNDVPFLVVADGTLVNAIEKNPTSTTRTISVDLTPDMQEIEVIGTFLASSASSSQPSIPTTPESNPQPAQPTQTTPQPSPPTEPAPSSPPAAKPIAPTKEENKTQEESPIQKEFVTLVEKIPYISTNLQKLGSIDYAVIGAIVLLIIIVIASTARRRKGQYTQKRLQN